ncbi:N-glycosylase [Candidatus Woesearchaeota archaeon CG11_big_fil_rev_8_21_14_0_20_43_8]|nr:MAG: N-glycosylase [Candidatus Woesearchaeota archaeon CG11_big_fil_rev_8_21_14_0_20_43_8]PIO05479.1 MAG: N-glycosylase [Candidatus Woesearchaeota archaeon CG08_land_8_20_14_0_20_43_7]
MDLKGQVRKLKKSHIGSKVQERLLEFKSFEGLDTKAWFSELCFCLLTANSKAQTALSIQRELSPDGFCECTANEIKDCIMRNKHRFHNNKTNYIMSARDHIDIKEKILKLVKDHGETGAREWLVKNIKGLGYKEASHFLRNVGFCNLAILDRHIINLLIENGLLKEKPKSLTKKIYLEIEERFMALAGSLKMSAAELDLYMWYIKAGEVLK